MPQFSKYFESCISILLVLQAEVIHFMHCKIVWEWSLSFSGLPSGSMTKVFESLPWWGWGHKTEDPGSCVTSWSKPLPFLSSPPILPSIPIKL